jgi:hypothetical protein
MRIAVGIAGTEVPAPTIAFSEGDCNLRLHQVVARAIPTAKRSK